MELRPTFFASRDQFRQWLKRHHRSVSELWVGFHKRSTGSPSITRRESVEEALCFGWIDGIGKKLDEDRYVVRFTPRKSNKWSALNVRLAKALIAEGRMQPSGLAAFKARDRKKSGYSIADRHDLALTKELEAKFRANKAAWKFFEEQPPGYRRNGVWFVMSAKQDATRARRLEILIAVSAAGRRLDPMRPLSEQLRGPVRAYTPEP